MRKAVLIIVLIWIALGIAASAALAGSDATIALFALIFPAVPFALIENTNRGVLWDSAHGPPFLTTAGVVVIYLLPVVIGLTWLWRTRRSSRAPVS